MQNAREGGQSPARSVAVSARVEPSVLQVVGGDDIARCGVVGRQGGERQTSQVEGIVCLETVGQVLQVEGQEVALRFAQGRFRAAQLQNVFRVGGRETQGLSAVHDVFPQSHGDVGNTLFGLFVADGVKVQRARHTGERGVEHPSVGLAHHLLQHNGHLLLVYEVLRGREVRLAVAVEHRGIHRLDGRAHQAHGRLFVVGARYHVRGVDAGKGLVMRVLQNA